METDKVRTQSQKIRTCLPRVERSVNAAIGLGLVWLLISLPLGRYGAVMGLATAPGTALAIFHPRMRKAPVLSGKISSDWHVADICIAASLCALSLAYGGAAATHSVNMQTTGYFYSDSIVGMILAGMMISAGICLKYMTCTEPRQNPVIPS